MPFMFDSSDQNDLKAVDNDRGATLRRKWIAPSGSTLWDLQWKNQQIYFETRLTEVPTKVASALPERESAWLVTAVAMPQGFTEGQSVLCDVIRDALQGYKRFPSPTTTPVTFSQAAFSTKVNAERMI